ncbi:hypothetical protein pb186bvf_008269 [Paramecium bursaria]
MKKKQQDDFISEDEYFKKDIFPRWQELKPFGKNIHRRSYHSCVVWDNYLYIYGGYEANEGILDDLCRIPLPQSGKPLQWATLYTSSDDKPPIGPGQLRNHAAITLKDKMYIVGGKENLINSCSKVWTYDLHQNIWEQSGDVEVGGQKIAIEGHNLCLYNDNLVIFGGFQANKGYMSQVLMLENGRWEMLWDGGQQGPKGRASAGAVIVGKELYIFGGNNVEVRFGDFWKFDLETKQWFQLTTTKSPGTRSSAALIQHPQGILLFGGIHDITHEKNDVWLYKNNDWVVLEEDNSRRQTDDLLNDSVFDKASQGRTKAKKIESTKFLNFEEEGKSPKRNSLKHIPIQQKQLTDTANSLQMNNMDELKKRRQQQKKQQMLAEFELNEDEKIKLRNSSPTTEQIKHSLGLIMNQQTQQRKVHSPIRKGQASLQGKKPCARDGHSAVVIGDQMYIFGGDRNLMSFNDIYVYNMGTLKAQ